MAAMEGVELWLRWFLLVSPQSWPRHHPPRRGDLERAKRRRQPGWWILESRGEIRQNLALRSQIVLCPSPCDRHACCLWWISLSCNFSLLTKFTLLTNLPFGITESDHLALRELRAATAFCLPPSPCPRRRVRLYLVQKVRRLPQILPRVENWQTIHLRRGNVERP